MGPPGRVVWDQPAEKSGMPNSDQDSNFFVSLGRLMDSDLANAEGASSSALPVIDLSSSEPFDLPEAPPVAPPAEAEPPAAADGGTSTSPSGLWLNGDVLMCACPDCGAPMSIRLWLMIADCWHCGTSLELTEEQEREAQRLLAERDRARRAAPAEPKPATQAKPPPESLPVPPPRASGAEQKAAPVAPQRRPREAAPPAAQPPVQRPSAAAGAPPRPRSPSSRPPMSAAQRRIQNRLREATRKRSVSAWIHDFFDSAPAWLISLVFHLVMLTLLALFDLDDETEGPFITLSTTVSKVVAAGGDVMKSNPQDEVVFDLPVPREIDLRDEQQREAIIKANQDARELRLDPDVVEPDLPDVEQVKRMVGGPHGAGQALAARDPRIRVDMVKREGGTTLTEAAVARGLRWLALHQHPDGYWSLDRFNHSPGCSCSGGGSPSDSAGTALGLLPFLGAGQTHLVGRYQDAVSRGLRWMLDEQREDGDLRGNSRDNAGMYAHGQATIVLCEAFLMTGDEELRDPAQRAVDFIVAAQHPAGGWRYQPKQPGDTSVVGWQVMALQSARAAGLDVPDATLELTGQYLDSVSSRDGALYAYQPSNGPTEVMTAEALLCRMYLGWTLDEPGLREGIAYLATRHLPDPRQTNIYYWYYGTQALHHHGGPEWEAWNARMRDILIATQEDRGHQAGSWDPEGPHASAGGRVYMTALAVCSLEVYYRHLPIFRQLSLE